MTPATPTRRQPGVPAAFKTGQTDVLYQRHPYRPVRAPVSQVVLGPKGLSPPPLEQPRRFQQLQAAALSACSLRTTWKVPKRGSWAPSPFGGIRSKSVLPPDLRLRRQLSLVVAATQRQLTTPVAHAVPATAAAVECSEVAEAGLASKAQPDSGGAGEACEMEDAKPSGSWRIEPEVLKQEAMQGLASKNPHLPQPVRVTVGPNAFRQQQQQIHNHQQSSLQSQQQQQNAIPQAAKKRGRDAGGASHRQWGSADGDDSDGQKKRGGSSRGAAGRGARRDADDIEDKPPVFGMFYPDRYMVGVDCILVDGMFVSRSRFEKLGGSLMAKWYRSIRVVDTAEPLGAWLERHNLPVFTGKARQRRQRGAPSTNASAAAAMAAASAAAAANTNNTLAGDTDKNRGSSNNLGLDVDAGTSACGTDGAWPACLDVKAEPERFSAMGAGLAVGEALTPGHGGSGGSGSDEGLAADLSVTQRSRPGFPADKMSRLEGTLGVDNADYWQGMRPLMLGQRSMMIGIHLSDTEALKLSNLSHTALAARDSLAWGPGSLPAGDCAYDGAACPPTGLSIRRFGSDGDAGLAAGAHTLGCAGPSKLAAEATVMRAPAAVGKVAGGGCYGDVSAVAGCTEAGELSLAPASSCRLPESTSLESAPTTSSSRWTSSNFVLSPGAGGLMQYNSIDPVNEDGGPAGRHDWDSDSWAYPCGPLPPDMSAPAQVPTPAQYGQYELQQQQQQLHKQLYPAMSRQQMHDPQLGAPPTVWPQSRTKPQQEEINRTAQSPFVQVQQQGTEQQSLQGDSSSFSVSGGARAQSQLQPAQGGVSVATAMAPPFPEAIDPGLPSLVSPPVLVPAATAEATDSPAQLTPQKSGHMYPPSSRHWPPYSNHYWPCHPYPPGHTRSVPGMPPRLPVGPGGPVRPYQRNVYPREMTPPAPAPSPAPFTPPYGCYYSHPYPRRGLPPTTYRRRYAAPGPGTVDVPPGVYGARYEAAALSGPYVPGRPEVEAPMDGAAAGSMLHPTTSACLDDVGLSVAGTSACMPAAPSVSRAPPGGAVAGGDSTCGTAAGAASGRMSSGGAVMPQTELQPPSLPLQQQHRGIATAASMTTAYPYSWASTPQHVARPFPTNSRNQHPQHMHEGGFAADMGMGLTSSSAAASYRPQVPGLLLDRRRGGCRLEPHCVETVRSCGSSKFKLPLGRLPLPACGLVFVVRCRTIGEGLEGPWTSSYVKMLALTRAAGFGDSFCSVASSFLNPI
ncbi:RegA-like protein RlsE [Volvox carteri f. nagariensis]|uniref:RegA-like protein RlsE n=1 Tax=Volvox carteri f. nagariensis TaxID=3068 RepID=D8U1T2_VOLCA|nr:RegA-like protein RlsE [Volvox carteri f. nagariensis]EFJ46168.1 RegA-like protein RlsE [Volvox carteri f. nagariensis]|eukprot:XP_002952615.1 RegA-like protein RlsE [Volvox carteri f. nagariensis]